ncbi:L,D-transpeptidase family protein [Thiorhodococcus mannitoliphagus]|uniref:L,D-transpeptidase family protein n=1 Tax=Thiorhodococcus mannitoliphagus TaxID=329406 RepID=UPI0030B8840A
MKKAERRLYLMRGDQRLRSYPIALGFSPKGHKRREGDGRTPEGRYVIDWKNSASRFRKSLHLSYPNPADARRAAFRHQAPGGMIMIHGQPSGHRDAQPIEGDWTLGCIAVSNPAIEEIWSLTSTGVPIEILP